ncbi:pleiotropic drug resistance protein 1-like [Mercurialis annua]|uniref:pleiotropic drug resistance protein 1-like n=1 Tax=Mercurialis annua TaxID=3986 RepID=UPI00215F7349|nr:pleiotropic drug resistance protein 1-like [Mercurialis annua]
MEGSNNVYSRAGSSSSTTWQLNSDDIFSKSSREDEEEALIWAALQRLPTYKRLKTGMLSSSSKRGAIEVDIQNIELQERQSLLQRLVKIDDNERFLWKIKNRVDRVGLKFPTVEVRFEQLNVEAQVDAGSRTLPSLISFFLNILHSILKGLHILPSKKIDLPILRDVSGIIHPSRMTLLLGPPSSGKTTLLLALAGKLDRNLKFSGSVTYNGHGMNEFIPQRIAAYIGQHDLHIGEMTVRETLAFAARCQGVGLRHEMLAELLRREKAENVKPDPDIDVFMKAAAIEGQEVNVMTDYVLKILGLEACADIMVGNAMIRGISGGQQKRLTTGEMLVGPARGLFMDEISNGLDSSTTYQIVRSLRQFIRILNGTAVISLLQPAPETFELFDDIILLSDGQIVYHGPRANVLEFFEHMGFKCPERKGVADFLQEVTSRKDQGQYWARNGEPYTFMTVKEFVEAFQSFHVGQNIKDKISTPFNKVESDPAALTSRKYGVDNVELFKACFSRELLLLKRNAFLYVFKNIQASIMAVIAMTVFFRTEMHRDSVIGGGKYLGALFYSLLVSMFNGLVEAPLTLARLPVFYKERDSLFYSSWAFSLPHLVLKIPISIMEVAVWVVITYYGIGFDPNVGRFFKQYLLLILVKQMASALFQFIAATGRDMVIANSVGIYISLVIFSSGGFILSQDMIKKWWKWAYWISPMMYGQNAITINELLGKSWSHVLPNSTETLGAEVLNSRAFFTDAYWYWIGVGALFGYTFLFNSCYIMALTFLGPLKKPQTIIPTESQSNGPGDSQQEGSRSGVGQSSSYRSFEKGSSPAVETIDVANHDKKKGMVLPFEPHFITFNEITYSIDMPLEMKNQGVIEDKLMLIHDVSGAFRPGVLTALMGVTGAGKTTMMDVLAGRKTTGYTQGTITISGYPKKQETFARISGYCEQNDIHSPNVTVFESLFYSAWLRLPIEVDAKTRKMFIEEVMELVELNHLRHALIGLPGVNGLSTEQRKRLTIAVELVANPSIIFMDEPTSGLDARAAAIVMRTVRNTVDTGRTVVCTIHQPSIDIFESFDELILLKQGGQEIYVGPLGHNSSHLVKYFEGIEAVNKIKDGYNPATWMLEVTAPAQEISLRIDFADIYRNSEQFRRTKAVINELNKPVPGSKDLYFRTQYAQSLFFQFIACLWKQRSSYWRNSSYTAVRFIHTIVIALTLGTMFWRLGSKTKRKTDLLNAMGSLYAAVLFLGIRNAGIVQAVVAVERSVFYRERAAGMYSAFPYAFAQLLVELPYTFVEAMAYGLIVYTMMGFEFTAVKIFWYLFFIYFTLLYFTFYGMMAVAMTPNQQISMIVSTAFYSIWNLFSGYIIPRTQIPIWWRWCTWTSPVSWTLYGLFASQFGDLKDTVTAEETVEHFLRTYFGYRHDFLGVVAVVVVGFTILFAFVFVVSIKMFTFQRR